MKGRCLQINYILRKGRRCSSNNGQHLFVQIQRCVVWKVSNLDEIRDDDKLKKEEKKENIDDNNDKQEVEPHPGPLQVASL